MYLIEPMQTFVYEKISTTSLYNVACCSELAGVLGRDVISAFQMEIQKL